MSLQTIDRRRFFSLTAGLAVAPTIPAALQIAGLSVAMAGSLRAMNEAMTLLESASDRWRSDYKLYGAAGLHDREGFWDWYKAQPSTIVYDDAVQRARDAVERAFMTKTASYQDEDAVMLALAAYAEIAASSFAVQTARDLNTPQRFQTYPLDRLRHALLTDPDEDFVKSGMPGFLRRLRENRAA